MEFSNKAVELCSQIINAQYEVLGLTKQLEEQFVASGFIVPFQTTYQELKNNAQFNRALTQYLAVGLRNTVEGSKFGNKIISDFELFHKMKTDREYNAKGWNGELIAKMKKSRTKLKHFVFRTKERILLDLDLEDTPDVTQVAKLKREADKAIVEKAHETLAKVARKEETSIIEDTAGMDLDDEREDVVDMSKVTMEPPKPEEGLGSNVIRTQHKLLSVILQTFPQLTDGAILLRYNADEKAICVSDRYATVESEKVIYFTL